MENNRPDKQAFWHNFFSILYLTLVILATYYLEKNSRLTEEFSIFDFFIVSMATFRLIRLFVYDSVTEHIRQYLGRFQNGMRRELSMLINCPWCTGIWMGTFVAFIFFLSPLSRFFILALAIAGAGSFIQILIWKIGLEQK